MPHGKRPPPTEPLESVLDSLYDLWFELSHSGGDKDKSSYLEMYNTFNETSDHGRGCTYSQKARHLFLSTDYDRVKQQLTKVLNTIRTVPGDEGFGSR